MLTSNKDNLINAVTKGIFGVSRKELEDSVRGQIEMWVRTGYFNEKNEDGSPKDYPFSDLAKDRNPVDYTSEENQSVALDAARESIVLLKNTDGLLPLSKDSSIAVTGIFADTRFKATYSVRNTPDIDDSGLSPLGAIRKAIGEDKVTYGSGAKIVAFESVLNDKTVTASVYEEGAQLTASYDPPDVSVVGSVYGDYVAGGKVYTNAEAFEVYAWGQDGYSYKSLANNKWLKYTGTGGGWGGPPLNPNGEVMNNDDTCLNLTENPFSKESSLPGRFRREVNEDGTITLLGATFTEGFGGGFETAYYTSGRFVTVNDENGIRVSAETIGDAEGAAARTDAEKFREIVLKDAGADAEAWAQDNDYAIVVVGTPARHSSGEGADRSDLNLGDDQYEIVANVAKAFPKKTIVIVKSNYPVNMEPIQNDENVAAILYQPYAGQYDSKALADVIFGDYAPTGRLTTTWYAGTESFPEISKYSLPEGTAPATLEEIDPRFTVDMTNGDPIDAGMTYMYTNADVTYEFGFGLSYSTFEYSNFKVPDTVNGEAPFQVTVDVKNTGTVNTDEVVQLYIKNNNSAYGSYTPKKQLVSYEKVYIPAGQTKTVTLAVNPADFAVWDVNRGDYVAQTGEYTLMVGKSSDILPLEKEFTYYGESIAALDATTKAVNVFDSAFATKDVVYREVSKIRTAEGLKNDASEYGYYAVVSKNSGAWVALKKVRLSGVDRITLRAASTNPTSVIEVRADSPTGTRLAVASFDATSEVTRDVPVNEGADYDFKVIELDYTEITEDFITTLSGYHDLYLVFKNPDIRVDSIQLHRRSGGSSGSSGSGTSPASPTEPVTPTIPTAPSKKFNDTAGYSWAEEAIEALASEGIVKGTSENTFEPGKNINRADFMLLLVRALKLEAEADSNFTDVAADAYYAEALGIAKKLGIATGVGEGRFDPTKEISRQDLMVLVFRALKVTGIIEEEDIGTVSDLTRFADASQVADYAVSSVATLVKMGIIKGDGANINPNGIATRAEAAVIIYRIFNLLK